MDLFDANEPAGGLLAGLRVDPEFAAAFEARKRGQELKKLRAQYGDQALDEDEGEETEYSSEDSDAEFATPAVDAAIFKTLARIRQRDPAIYDPSRQLFDEEEHAGPSNPRKKAKLDKPTRLKDFQRKQLLAGGADDLDDDVGDARYRPTPAQESAALRRETTAAFHTAVASDDEEGSDDGLLVPRLKTADEVAAEDEDYRTFLAQQGATFEPSIDEDEGDAFLRNYMLSRAWLDKDKARSAPPTHAEVLDVDDDEDAAFEEHAEQFEHAFNYRFEDPLQGKASDVVTHARHNEASVRKVDDRRKVARQERKRLQELKKEEALAKLKKVHEMAGGQVAGLENYDLDADFDPEEHDRQMGGAFADETYYAGPADPMTLDEEGKPVWDDDIDITDIVGADVEDDVYDPSAPEERPKKKRRKGEPEVADGAEAEAGPSTKKKRKRSKLDELLDDDVPYAQIIGGGTAARFHYQKVEPTDFGLTPAEILLATDAELNAVASLKRLATYRTTDSGKRNRRAMQELRDRLRRRKWGDMETGYEDQRPLKPPKASKATGGNAVGLATTATDGPIKRKGKKRRERERQKAAAAAVGGDAPAGPA